MNVIARLAVDPGRHDAYVELIELLEYQIWDWMQAMMPWNQMQMRY